MDLPAHLRERIDPNATAPRSGRYVMCWLRTAVRADDNPAIDVALSVAAQLGLPCFVYHAVDERYPYASDRLHTFALEGASDLQRDLQRRGVGAVFHVARPGHRGAHLQTLATGAAVVVADFMPVSSLSRWDAQIEKVAPLWRVDASCIAPMWLLPTAHTRAFSFRQQASPLWRERVRQKWHDVQTQGPPFVPELPFVPVDLQQANIAELVASCAIDHGIGPVHQTKGGSTAADARWRSFVANRMQGYHRDRNDPLIDGAVSAMSAYLHFGHISPFRMAREAANIGGDGSAKYLDELLTWRELAWNFCRHHPEHENTDALPAWAVSSLAEHEDDERPFLPSWEQLARGHTGDELWDACQRSLLIHGQLHNNLRMTWGKALLSWTKDAHTALRWLYDLNNRYALDGRDPASAGGILWCLGAFDRPFTPAQPILGVVRPRPLDNHSARLDLAAYTRQVSKPARGKPLSVAIVGAGVAGAACARALVDAGHHVTMFDKGTRPGGRSSTRIIEDQHAFDHGAQYFTVRDDRFRRWVDSWRHEQLVAPWKPRTNQRSADEFPEGAAGGDEFTPSGGPSEEMLVAMPGMSALLQRMLVDVDVRYNRRITAIERQPSGKLLVGDDVTAIFDAVVVATPSPQAAELLAAVEPTLATTINRAVMMPTWAAMFVFDQAPMVDFDVCVQRDQPVRWLARESSKPGRRPGARWVAHASAAFSATHIDRPAEQVLSLLHAEAEKQLGRCKPIFATAHLWRYAFVEQPLAVDSVVSEDGRVVVCGDWCLSPRIESAFLSGTAAAGRLLSWR
jgi:photolyase PhrII